MERELGLGQAQLTGELTNTALTNPQGFKHLEPEGICHGLKQGPSLDGIKRHRVI
jgi:hypothetical protein